MDRNLIDPNHAWVQMITRMQRDINDLRARVGSSAVVTGEAPEVDLSTSGVAAGSTTPVSLVTVGTQPGLWVAHTSATFVGNPVAGAEWTLSSRLLDRAGAAEITAEGSALPTATMVFGASAGASTVTLNGLGWLSIEPSDHPDGFTLSLDIATPGADAWPMVLRARVALLPF